MSHQRPRQPGVRAVRPRSIGVLASPSAWRRSALLGASILGLGGPGTALAAAGREARGRGRAGRRTGRGADPQGAHR